MPRMLAERKQEPADFKRARELVIGTGALSATLDLAGDYAVTARIGRGVPTVDMRVDYHQAAMAGPLHDAA